jgi:hypothetical protein
MPLGYTNIGSWSCGNGNAGLSACGYLHSHTHTVHHISTDAVGLAVTAAGTKQTSILEVQMQGRVS